MTDLPHRAAIPTAKTLQKDLIRVALLLLATAVGGVIYQSTQTALPKHFATELKD